MDTLHGTACELPGVSIKFGPFMQIMRRAVELEWVRPEHAEFVAHGLRWGFDVGVRRHLLRGQRVFANYESSRVCGGVQAHKRAQSTHGESTHITHIRTVGQNERNRRQSERTESAPAHELSSVRPWCLILPNIND